MLYLIVGHMHARSRLKKGLPPLAYHRCLVGRKAQQPQYQNGWPQGGQNYGYYQAGGYPMGNMPPPPTYDPSRPPMYSGPPDGGSKVDPWQATNRPAEANPAPSYYPPPPAGQATGITR
ncbi:hypothetical protein CDD82_2751 [Ophiocordyceps australis]|uniref:Uncharacterized protein n=1 Tax=Ophiocordyceps australis TaxID=1399860 RepID=A0A2C5ZGC2_9HYPO|nr:hypothetical protein CDD82_2751 [Ophiocordyceps australis]